MMMGDRDAGVDEVVSTMTAGAAAPPLRPLLLPPLPLALLVEEALVPGTSFVRPQCVHVTDEPGVADVRGAPQFSQLTKADLHALQLTPHPRASRDGPPLGVARMADTCGDAGPRF